MNKQYYVYMLANKYHGTIYTGMTNNISRRILEHKSLTGSKFTSKYIVHRLVYVEETTHAIVAIEREKQIKSWKRHKKIELIEKENPNWLDLYSEYE